MGFGGDPTGAAPRWLAALLPAAVWAVVLWQLARAGIEGHLPGAAVFLAGLLVTVQALAVGANTCAGTWRDAHLPGGLLPTPLVVGLLAAWLVGRRGRQDQVPPCSRATPPAARLGSKERAVWVGTATNPGAALPVAIPIVVGGPMVPRLLQDGAPISAVLPFFLVPLVLIGLPALAFAMVRVVVGPHGASIGLGPWGWPTRRFAVADIVWAGTDFVEPIRFGGWGWRLGGGARTAVVIRRGEALVLDLADGSRFTVTVDGAEHAASLLNAYRLIT